MGILKTVSFREGAVDGDGLFDVHVPHVAGQLIRAAVTEQVPIAKLTDTQSQSTAKPLDQVKIPVESLHS